MSTKWEKQGRFKKWGHWTVVQLNSEILLKECGEKNGNKCCGCQSEPSVEFTPKRHEVITDIWVGEHVWLSSIIYNQGPNMQ